MKKKNSGWPFSEGTEDHKKAEEGRFYTPSDTACKHCNAKPLNAYYVGSLKKCKNCGNYV